MNSGESATPVTRTVRCAPFIETRKRAHELGAAAGVEVGHVEHAKAEDGIERIDRVLARRAAGPERHRLRLAGHQRRKTARPVQHAKPDGLERRCDRGIPGVARKHDAIADRGHFRLIR